MSTQDDPKLAEFVLPAAPANPKRLVYIGTPEAAVPPLRALHDAGYEIVLVLSAPDRRRGRGSKQSASPVKAAALELGLPVTDQVSDLLQVEADLGVVVAFGQIIRRNVLERLPLINLHFSLLPRWRGAAPVERAILAGDAVTGVCVMVVEEGLDTGGVYRRVEVPIDDQVSLEELRSELVVTGSKLLVDALHEGLGAAEPQSGATIYAKKLNTDDLHVDWGCETQEILRQVRLGRAWTTFRGKRMGIWAAKKSERTDLDAGQLDGLFVGSGSGAIELSRVQPEGKPQMAATDWKNGAQPSTTDVFE